MKLNKIFRICENQQNERLSHVIKTICNLIDIFVDSKDGSIPYNNNLFRKIYGKILKYIDLKIEKVNTIKQEFNNEII